MVLMPPGNRPRLRGWPLACRPRAAAFTMLFGAAPAHRRNETAMSLESNWRTARRALAVAALSAGWATMSAAAGRAPAMPDSTPDLSALDLEQLMAIQVVYAASKHSQQTRDVPSFVSVVTAEQIREHGYRTVGDVLKTLPSFYVSNDRNYSY